MCCLNKGLLSLPLFSFPRFSQSFLPKSTMRDRQASGFIPAFRKLLQMPCFHVTHKSKILGSRADRILHSQRFKELIHRLSLSSFKKPQIIQAALLKPTCVLLKLEPYPYKSVGGNSLTLLLHILLVHHKSDLLEWVPPSRGEMTYKGEEI